ncbi:transposable element Tcb1 transposase [Trichonephila clavipes]|nr:transposable element Tcb1 transposase [Trichonephila clavipes]
MRRGRQSGISAKRPLLRLPLTGNRSLQHHDGQIRVWRHRGERLLNCLVMHRHTGPAAGIMAWVVLHFTATFVLVRIGGTMNSQHYISKNELLPWPTCSPDLSLIENVWSMLAQQLSWDTPATAIPDQLWQHVEASLTAVHGQISESL